MNKQSVSSDNKLTQKNLIGYGLGDFGGCMTFMILGSFLTPYYTEVAGLSTGSVAGMYLILKVWDAINDPLMGALLDKVFARTHSAKGKFRPWMLRATPLLMITFILMFTAPTYTNGVAKILVAFVTYLLYEGSYTMFNIPYGSLLSAMSNDDAQRAKLSSARGVGSTIGSLIPLAIFPVILSATESNPQFGYTAGVTVCAVIGFIACLLSCKWTTENHGSIALAEDNPEEVSDIHVTDILVVLKKNRAFVALCLQGLFYNVMLYMGNTLSIYMYRDVLGALPMMSVMTFISLGLSLVILAILPKIVEKIGLEKTVCNTQLISAGLYFALFLIMLVTNNILVYMVLYSVAYGFASITVLMQWGMVGEAIDYNEYLTGKRTEGSIYGFFNLTRRIGQAIGASVAVALLGSIGYVANATSQTSSVVFGIKVLVVATPVIFMLLCWVSLKFVWNITPEIRNKMTQRKGSSNNIM